MLKSNFNKNFNSLEFSRILKSLLEVKAICLLVILNVLVYIFTSLSVSDYYYMLLGLNALFFEGFYHQLLSSIFMHGSAEHLGMNMLALIAFGYRLERALGAFNFDCIIFNSFICCYFLLLSASTLIFREYVS